MDLDGSLADNLRAAIASARRLQGHRVHKDTLDFWKQLLTHAREVRRRGRITELAEVEELIAELEASVQAHSGGN
jgi:hypothetical protein